MFLTTYTSMGMDTCKWSGERWYVYVYMCVWGGWGQDGEVKASPCPAHQGGMVGHTQN